MKNISGFPGEPWRLGDFVAAFFATRTPRHKATEMLFV
jgi:hypothetical protein